MTFLGISSSLAGAEPGRSGFPASYTSLLDYPPAPRLGGLFWPLSGRASVKSVPLFGDDRARIEMSARVPSAAITHNRPYLASQDWLADHRPDWRATECATFRAALDLPKGALSPWVSASVNFPGVCASLVAAAPGAFAGPRSTGEFDHDHRH